MEEQNAYIGSPEDPRTAAIVSYITFIGWLVSWFWLFPSRKTRLVAYHLRQALLIHILSFLLKAAYSFLPYTLAMLIIISVLGIGLFIIWLISFINALNGKQKPAPLIGSIASKLFSGLGRL